MKTWKKVLLIISSIAAGIGIGCIIIGLILGVNWREIKSMVTNGYFSFTMFDWEDGSGIRWDSETGDKEESFSGRKNLEVDVDYSSVVLKNYDGSDVKVDARGIAATKFKVREKGNTLYIEDKTHRPVDSSEITIYLPKDGQMQEVSLDAGAGEIILDTLNTHKFSSEIGGGRLYISEKLTAHEIDCSVGAGQMDLASLSGVSIELDCGAGQITATLEGTQEDYSLEAECGLGQIQFGDESYGSLNDQISSGDGNRRIELDCGVGQIDIQFSHS